MSAVESEGERLGRLSSEERTAILLELLKTPWGQHSEEQRKTISLLENLNTDIPCDGCGASTKMLGSRLCDVCWQIKNNIRSFASAKNGKALAWIKNMLQENL